MKLERPWLIPLLALFVFGIATLGLLRVIRYDFQATEHGYVLLDRLSGQVTACLLAPKRAGGGVEWSQFCSGPLSVR